MLNKPSQTSEFLNILEKSYKDVGNRTWEANDFLELNLDVSRRLFTPESLAARRPQPKELEVFALLSGLPFPVEFTDRLIDMQQEISTILGEQLHYWVLPANFGVEYCVFKWPEDSWNEKWLGIIQDMLASKDQPSFQFSIRGIQINPDGCVVAKGFDEDSVLFQIREHIRRKIPFLPEKQSRWAHVPLGRILEPLGTERFAKLAHHITKVSDLLIAKTEIKSMKLIHERRWYMEEKTILANYPLATVSDAPRLIGKPRVVAVIQARMGSTRLPGKTMADLSGTPLLNRLLRQLVGASSLDEVVIATSVDPADDVIVEFATKQGVRVVRGSEEDVLSRYSLAAEAADADVVVRLTADCPLHSPDTVDEVVQAFLQAHVDYACNTNPYTRPDGQDVEVFSRDLLNRASASAESGPDREHVTLWMRRNADAIRLDVRHRPPDKSILRWSVDHPDDLEFARSVWSCLDQRGPGPFNFEEIKSAVIESGATQGKAIINEGFYLSLFKEASAEAAPPLSLNKSFAWLERSDRVIPGGAQTYSKSWRHHIRGVTPIFLSRGKGAIVWDVDGNQYIDLIQGLLPNILGYAHDEVNHAASKQADEGHSFSLAHPLEVELAERLCRIIPCAEMVRFGKNGSDATAGAVRIARAFTGREHVAVCGYHGWQDWYIGTTSRSAGVPKAVRELAHPFPYNDANALDALLSSIPNQFAAVIMEPVNFTWPAPGYLEKVKEIAHRHGALLIFDEICSGFHFGLGGAQQIFGVMPDLATFGKAIGNGWPISCIVGRRDVMKVFEDAFVSFTFAGDVSAMAAANKVLDILENGDAYARMTAAGTKLFDGARVLAAAAGLGDAFQIKGHPHWAILNFVDENGVDDPATRALWIQEITRRGVLMIVTHNICAALDESTVTKILSAYACAFKRVAQARAGGIPPETWLDGDPPTPAFRARG